MNEIQTSRVNQYTHNNDSFFSLRVLQQVPFLNPSFPLSQQVEFPKQRFV